MGAAASIAVAAGTAGLSLPAAAIFGAGFAAGAAWAAASDVVNEALDSVCAAAEAVMGFVRRVASSAYDKVKEAAAFVRDGVVKPVYEAASAAVDGLREVASSAFEKLKAAAALVKARMIKLVRHLLGRIKAAAARREVDRAAAAGHAAGHDDVLSTASARVAGFGQLLDVKALPPPPSSSAIISAAAAPGGALALHGSVPAAPAARAAGQASEMMDLLEAAYAVLGASIPEDARSCIYVVVAAVGIGLEAITAATKDA